MISRHSSITFHNRPKIWSNHAQIMTETFIRLSLKPSVISDEDFLRIEKFVCLAYDPLKRFKTFNVSMLRYYLFTISKENSFSKFPPSRSALRSHIQRFAFVAGYGAKVFQDMHQLLLLSTTNVS